MALSGHNSIILFGGCIDTADYRVERWNPDSANDEDLGAMDERLYAAYVGIGNDVYVIGGRLWDEQGNETEQVDKFNVPSRRWTPCAPLCFPRSLTACCSLEVSLGTQRQNGIIICGGNDRPGDSVKVVELYIPQQNRMYRLPSLQVSRLAGAAAALPDGRVFVAGGGNTRLARDDWDQASVEFCNLQTADWQTAGENASNFWHQAAPMRAPRRGHGMIYFRGKIIVAGGGTNHNSVEVFTPPDANNPLGQWTQVTPLATLTGCSALLIANNRLFAVDGCMAHTIEEGTTDEDLSTWQWTPKRAGTFIGPIYGSATALL